MRPVPIATVSSGRSTTCTGTSHSCASSMSKPRSSAPPPVRNMPVSSTSCVSSGGASASVRRTASTMPRTGSPIALRTSSSESRTCTVFPLASSRPITTAALPVGCRERRSDRDLDLLRRLLADRHAVLVADVPLHGGVEVEAADRHGSTAHDAAHRDDGHLGTPAADVGHEMADRLVHGQTGADRGRERFFDQGHLAHARRPDRFLDRPSLDLRTHRGHRHQHPRPREPHGHRAADHDLDHALGDVELGHRALAERADREHAARVAAQQLPGVLAHRQHFAGARVHRDDGRFLEDHALALAVHQRVRGAEVDREVPTHVRDRPSSCPSPSGRRPRRGLPSSRWARLP